MSADNKKNMNLTLKVWRQKNANDKGELKTYQAKDVSPDDSFLEMLDAVNENIIKDGGEPITFDHDCREGICGTCGFMIDGEAHGPQKGTTVCQLHMRQYNDGQTIVIEPFRARAFPMVKDLMVDRSALDRIIKSGGYISANTGGAPDANSVPIPKTDADEAFMSATCIGCGACVASCKNASASLFTSAKIQHLSLLPQGKVEREQRALNMVSQMETEGFGGCSVTGACEASCPKEISLINIATMNREFLKASLKKKDEVSGGDGA